jgi:hypothetical protein
MFYDGNYVNDAAPRLRPGRAPAARAVRLLRHGADRCAAPLARAGAG